MIQSKALTISDEQDLAQVAGPYPSTDYFDFGATGIPAGGGGSAGTVGLERDIGKGCPVPFEVIVTEQFLSGGAATLSVALQVADDTAFSVNLDTVKTSDTIALAELTVGKNVFPDLYLPTEVDQRYCRLVYTIGTATTTAGKISAFVSGGRQTNQLGAA